MNFSMSLPTILRRMIGLKALGESYDFLLGLGITTVVDFLKCYLGERRKFKKCGRTDKGI